MFRRLFVDHPASVDESYAEHMRMSAGFGWAMLKGSAGCFVHAVIPGLCQRTGSRTITQLHNRLIASRAVKPASRASATNWLGADI